MLRIVADTNVYISALNFAGTADEVLALGRTSVIEIFISRAILEEIEGVLRRKFRWTGSRSREAIQAIGDFAVIIEPVEVIDILTEDEPDNRILECAHAAGAALIVTGDRHLLRLGCFRDIRITSLRQFLDVEMKLRRT
ncbi:MAG: putative toxin-antitoxin system toxin component, PIN family [Proteobacteria bacterium]|nr:putative toxin-antitoxin system toxin component, PIN family [Pseudomonadota bacterium]MBI3498123.1 putative toxin-antitoxin system toxin component, PIN family [Pseudomonadota bacterium]